MDNIVCDDCFDFLPTLPSGSVDLTICDLPFGTTQCPWDSCLPLDKLWNELWRVSKPTSPVLMFASQPFTSVVVSSNIKNFRYEWIWEKSKASNFLDAKKKPLKAHESLLVFCRQGAVYHPQMSSGDSYKARPGKKPTDIYGKVNDLMLRNDNDGLRYPRSVVYFKTAESEGKVIHSTQKPTALLEYMLKTYTVEGDTVLDPCFGSGSLLVAAKSTSRVAVGCEKDKNTFDKAMQRIEQLPNNIFDEC